MNVWIKKELEEVKFGDSRLDKRVQKILSQFSNNPQSSIHGSSGGWAETKAAYRFFDNPKVTTDKILASHIAATKERLKEPQVVLCVQDTTLVSYSHRKQSVSGLGKLYKETDQGLLLHPTIAFSTDGVCLGVINYKSWIREEIKGKEKRASKKKPVEEKESIRWIESYRATNQIAHEYPNKTFINIADREGDFYELLQEYEDGKAACHMIVRAKSDRVIDETEDSKTKKLWSRILEQPVIGRVTFELSSASNKRKSRTISQTIRVCEFSISRARKAKNERKPIKMSAVLCSEENVPLGETKVEWLLLTSLDLKLGKVSALDVLRYYLTRWQIELFFKTLKSGCRIEELQLENIYRIENCIAMYMIISWRILFLTYIGRACPNVSCEFFYEKSEWQALYMVVHRAAPPDIVPSIDVMNRMVASCGGFLNRKSDKDPGIKTMWVGLQRLRDFTLAFEIFNNKKTYG